MKDYAFAGTNRGEIILYAIQRPLQKCATSSTAQDETLLKQPPHELLSNISAQYLKSGSTPSEKPIEGLHAMGCATHDVVIARNSAGQVFLIDPRELNIICTMPVKNVRGMCCNDGQPYLGLCLNIGSQLLVYDLQKSLEPFKRFTVPESPQRMLWLRGRICLGFRDEYTRFVPLTRLVRYKVLSEETGDVAELLSIDGKVPAVMKLLPSEEFALSALKSVVITDSSGDTPQKFKLMNQPKHFAFTFPYIYSLSESNALEIRNLHDQQFHEVIKVPAIAGSPQTTASLLADDGRHVFVTVGSHAFFVSPSSYRYQMGDLALFCKIAFKLAQGEQDSQVNSATQDSAQSMAAYLDRPALMGYLTGLFGSDKSPWKQLVLKHVYKFVQRFPYPESATLERSKHFVNQIMRCIYRTETAFFAELSSPHAREIVYVTTQVIFFAHIYGIVSAIVKEKFADQDRLYFQKLRELEHCSIADLGIRTKFHLSNESVVEEFARDSIRAAARRASDSQSVAGALPATQPGQNEPQQPFNFTSGAVSHLGDANLIEKDLSTSFETETRVQLVQDADYVMHINKYETTGFEELKILGKFKFDEGDLSVSWIYDSKLFRMRFDDENFFKQFCLQYQMYESSQGALVRSSSILDSSSLSSSVGSSPGGVLRGNTSFLFGSPRFSSSATSSNAPTLSTSLEPISSVGSGPVPVPNSNSQLEMDSISGSAPAAVSFSPNFSSSSSSSSPMIRSGSLTTRTKTKLLFEDVNVDDQDEFDEPETFKRKRRSDSQKSLPSAREASTATSRSRIPIKRRVLVVKPYVLDEDPYAVPIKTLRRLPGYRSPREKVECALKALNQTVQAINAFWRQHSKDVIVGADDLVPVFGYVVLKAAIPAIYFEMNFSMEFATESTLRGKYGYALATLQAAVEYLLTLSAPEDPDEHPQEPALSSEPMPVRQVSDLSESDFLVISHSPLHEEGLMTNRIDPSKLAEETDDARTRRLSRLISKVDRIHEKKQRDSVDTGIDEDLQTAAATPSKKRKPSDARPIRPETNLTSTDRSGTQITGSIMAPIFTDREKIIHKFGLDCEKETVLEWYTCTMTAAPASASGWLYVMTHHACFESAPMNQQQPIRVAIPFSAVVGIRKTWAFLSTGGVEITTNDHATYLFRNFRERDIAFNMIMKAYRQLGHT